MNWGAIGAIAELLGAVGVIASLVYLATQIRQSREQMSQNTRALRAGSYQQFDDSLQATVMEGGDRLRSGSRGTPGHGELRAAQRRGCISIQFLDEQLDEKIRRRLLPAPLWDAGRGPLAAAPLADLHTWFDNPGVVQWWRTDPTNLSPEFVALVSEILGEKPLSAPGG